jgi:short-subunit dehydrogenase
MAVHLWMNGLHRKLDGEKTGITVMMVHPGSIMSVSDIHSN